MLGRKKTKGRRQRYISLLRLFTSMSFNEWKNCSFCLSPAPLDSLILKACLNSCLLNQQPFAFYLLARLQSPFIFSRHCKLTPDFHQCYKWKPIVEQKYGGDYTFPPVLIGGIGERKEKERKGPFSHTVGCYLLVSLSQNAPMLWFRQYYCLYSTLELWALVAPMCVLLSDIFFIPACSFALWHLSDDEQWKVSRQPYVALVSFWMRVH